MINLDEKAEVKFDLREEDKSLLEPCKAEFKSIEYRLDEIYNKINNIDKYDEKEIRDIIKRQYNLLLDFDIFLSDPESRSYAFKLFSNAKFLKCLIDVVGVLDLTDRQIICLNKLAYDYYITPGNNPEISNLLFVATSYVNDMLVVRLSAVLGVAVGRILAMISKSTFSPEKRVHRVNTFITKYDKDFTIENVVYLIGSLYDRFGEYFRYSMLESKYEGMTLQQQKNFDSISSAIVTMLGCMTSKDMKKMLKDYACMLSNVKCKSVRFSIKSIPNERIQAVVRDVEMEYGIFIP